MLVHAPLQDPILSFLHTFSLKSAHVGGQNPPKMGPHPPMENPGSGPDSEICTHTTILGGYFGLGFLISKH